jgi:hypothetical protein
MPRSSEVSLLGDYSEFNAGYTLWPLEDFESLDRKTISALLKLIQVFRGYFREKSFKVFTKSSWRGLRA